MQNEFNKQFEAFIPRSALTKFMRTNAKRKQSLTIPAAAAASHRSSGSVEINLAAVEAALPPPHAADVFTSHRGPAVFARHRRRSRSSLWIGSRTPQRKCRSRSDPLRRGSAAGAARWWGAAAGDPRRSRAADRDPITRTKICGKNLRDLEHGSIRRKRERIFQRRNEFAREASRETGGS